MDTVIRYVGDIHAVQRQWLESEIGHQLRDDQQVIIQVLAPSDHQAVATRQAAFDELKRLSQQGARHRESSGVSEAEADEALNEAMASVRKRRTE